jgi:predicted permease
MLFQDFQYALRQLRKSPGFAALAVCTLALGIAANSTIFSWINSTLFNPIPGVRSTGNMLTLQRGERSEHASPPFSYMDYVDLRDGTKTLTGLLAYHDDYVAITGNGRPQRIYGALASANYFEVMGVKPILGGTLLSTQANERVGSPDVVLGYDLWQSRFGGDPAIIGKTTQINLHTYTVVGVAPRGFQGCKSGLRTELWIPLGMDQQIWGSTRIDDRGVSWLNVLGVLRPGVDHRQVENEFNLLMQRIAASYPASHQGNNLITTDPLWRSPFGANVYLYGTLPILMALAAVLLLLACANVANLLLVRSVSRRREFAIRQSMGASRWKLVRQLMVENLLIALAGGGVALAITFWTARTLGSFLPDTTLPLNVNGSVDGTVILVTIFIAALTSIVAGVVPALRASSLSPMAVLKDEALNTSGGLHKSRLAAGLVVMQVALSLTLLVCAGLFVRSLNKSQNADLGFDADHVYLASFDLDPLDYSDAKALELDRQILARVRALPGVESATLADFSPLSFTIHSEGVLPEGYLPRPHESIEVDRGIVGTGYLQTLRAPLIAGRDFNDADSANKQLVAIVNQAFVNRYWPGQNAIGKRVQVSNRTYLVAGVAANGKYRRLADDAAPLVLLPLTQSYADLVTLHVRVNGDPMAFSSSIDQAVHELSPDLPLFNVTTLKTNMRMGNVFERIVMVLAGSFGLLAMLLAAVGVYGVVAYSTKQRTHEIGIRMALGAARGDVFRQILRAGMRLTLIGLAVGLAVSFAFTRLLRGMLFGVGTADWITFATVAVALCVVALVACYIPARRAASVEPMQALRTE